MRRIFIAIGGPPGSTVSMTVRPMPRRRAASRRIWVVLPEPSMPSKVMKRPRCFTGREYSSVAVAQARTERTQARMPVLLYPFALRHPQCHLTEIPDILAGVGRKQEEIGALARLD